VWLGYFCVSFRVSGPYVSVIVKESHEMFIFVVILNFWLLFTYTWALREMLMCSGGKLGSNSIWPFVSQLCID
jgi:hypothetical protein